MLESAQSQEPLASSRKHIKLIGGAVGKMRENTQSQEGEPLARCSKAHKVKRESRWQDARKHTKSRGGPVSKILEST